MFDAPQEIQCMKLPAASSDGEAKKLLMDAISGSDAASQRGLLRVEIPCGSNPLFDWLAEYPAPRFLWMGRGGELEMAGVGIADRLSGEPGQELPAIRDLMGALEGETSRLRYYFWTHFRSQLPKEAGWKPFGPWALVLPRFERVRGGQDSWFACHIRWNDAVEGRDWKTQKRLTLKAIESNHAGQARTDLRSDGHQSDRAFDGERRIEKPDQKGWRRGIVAAQHLMRKGPLKKVVLARSVAVETETPVDALGVMAKLAAVDQKTFRFYLEIQPGVVFLGASPERLFRVVGTRLEVDSLAGTRPRGVTIEEDQALAQALLESKKDRHEQQLVTDNILKNIGPLCDSEPEAQPVSVWKWNRVQHLASPIVGTLKDGVSPSDLLEKLHPTPAVGGMPQQVALDFIGENEDFERGLYAAPVGWIGKGTAEMTVAIRSARIDGRELVLYSGAGIVPGSDPSLEWAEINTKISGFEGALGWSTHQDTSHE